MRKYLALISLATIPFLLGSTAVPTVTPEPENTKEIVRTEVIETPVRYVELNTLPEGIEIVEQEGAEGELSFYVTKEKTTDSSGNAIEVPVYSEAVTKLPKEKIITKGTNKTVIKGVDQKVLDAEKAKADEAARVLAEAERAKAAEEARKAAEARSSSSSSSSSSSNSSSTSNTSRSSASPSYTGGGSKEEWLRASGIAESDWGYVDYIVNKESTWNPNAVNSSSGASGLVQALPCGKVPGSCFNPVDNLRWADGYAKDRYGSWAEAYAFWTSNHWW